MHQISLEDRDLIRTPYEFGLQPTYNIRTFNSPLEAMLAGVKYASLPEIAMDLFSTYKGNIQTRSVFFQIDLPQHDDNIKIVVSHDGISLADVEDGDYTRYNENFKKTIIERIMDQDIDHVTEQSNATILWVSRKDLRGHYVNMLADSNIKMNIQTPILPALFFTHTLKDEYFNKNFDKDFGVRLPHYTSGNSIWTINLEIYKQGLMLDARKDNDTHSQYIISS